MASTQEQYQIHMRLLGILDEFRGTPAREDAIVDQYNIQTPESRLSRGQVAGHLEAMRKRGFVDFEIPLAGPKRWKITRAGKVQYQEYEYEEL